MTVSLRNTPLIEIDSGTLTPSVTGSWNSTVPVANDLLVAVVQCQALTTTALGSTPAGWTLSSINETNAASTETRVTVYTRIATGADTAPTFTATFTGTAADDNMAVLLYDFSDDSGQPPVLGPHGVAQGTSGTVAPVTTGYAVAGSYGIGGISAYGSAAVTWTTPTAPSTWTSQGTSAGALTHDSYANYSLAAPPAGSTLTCSMAHSAGTTTFEAAFVALISPPPRQTDITQPGGKTWQRRVRRRQQLQQQPLAAPPVTLDSATQPVSPYYSATSPITWTHTNHGGILLVAVTTFTGSSNLCTGVTYGGVSMTFEVFVQSNNDVFGGIALYALNGASLLTGANTVSVSFTGGGDTAAFAMSFLNANQLGTVYTSYGTSATASITVSSTTAGRLVADFVATGSGVTSATAPNVQQGNLVSDGSGGTGYSAMGTDPSTGAAVSPHWAVTSDEWCMIAVEVYQGYAPLVIAFHPLPGGLPGAAYSNTLTATGGSGGYSWTVSSGSLPGWCSLSAGGVLSGTPGGGDVGSTTFTLKVTDSASETQTEQFTLWVLATRCIMALSGTSSTACFTDQTGTPMLMFCDSAWSMVYRAGASGSTTWEQDITQYVSTRSAQGFTAVQCNLMPNNEYVTSSDKTWDGIYPFNSTTDPTSGLNSTYWARVDYLVLTCSQYGMTFFMNLLMGEDITTGCAASWTSTQQNAWGAAVAERYLDNPNVVWMINDDDGVGLAEMQAILTGARSTGDNNPIAAEQQTECTSRTIMQTGAATDGATLPPTYNWVYSYNADYLGIEIAYQESSPIPVLRGDGYYFLEGIGSGKEDLTARNQLWWALASGSRGFSGGVGDGEWIFGTGWASQMTATAEEAGTAGDYQNNVFPAVSAFWKALPGWQKLIPDTASVFITAGRGTRATAYAPGLGSGTSYDAGGGTPDTYVAGSIAADGTLAVIYFSPGVSTTITIDQTKLEGSYVASWVDPCNCAVTSATPGSTYTKPSSANSAGGALDHDWVLVLGPALGSGAVNVTGVAAAVTVAGSAGTSAGGAGVTGTGAAVTVQGAAGTPAGGGAVTGAAASVTVHGAAGTTSGGAGVTGIAAPVTVTAAAGVLSAGVALTGTAAAVTVQGGAGTSAGGAGVTGTGAAVTVQGGAGVPFGGSSGGANVTGVAAAVTVQGAAGVPSGGASVTGTAAAVTVQGGTGAASGGAAVTGVAAAVTVQGGAGTPAGAAAVTGVAAHTTVQGGAGTFSAAAGVTGTAAPILVLGGTGVAAGGGTRLAGTVTITDYATATVTVTDQLAETCIIADAATGTVQIGDRLP